MANFKTFAILAIIALFGSVETLRAHAHDANEYLKKTNSEVHFEGKSSYKLKKGSKSLRKMYK